MSYHGTLAGLFSNKRKPESESEPTSAERLASLREQLQDTEEKLAALDIECRNFRTEHTLRTDSFGRVVGMAGASISAYASVEREWRILLKTSDRLFSRRNDLLRALAAQKESL